MDLQILQTIFSGLEVIIGAFFGWLSWHLWKKDQEKTEMITELKNQTIAINEQLSWVMNREKPQFNIEKRSTGSDYYSVSLKNVGSDMFNFKIENVKGKGIKRIEFRPTSTEQIARETHINITFVREEYSNVGYQEYRLYFSDIKGNNYFQTIAFDWYSDPKISPSFIII